MEFAAASPSPSFISQNNLKFLNPLSNSVLSSASCAVKNQHSSSPSNHFHGKSSKTKKTCLLDAERFECQKLEKHFSALKKVHYPEIRSTQVTNSFHDHPSIVRTDSVLKIPTAILAKALKISPSVFQKPIEDHLSIFKLAASYWLLAGTVPCPSLAAETFSSTEQDSGKINIESIIISIDDFFNRYPFFVATVAFIWLVVIPLVEEYLRKYKYISAIDSFRKLKSDPKAQLLDIRDKPSLSYLRTPNLKILGKKAAQVVFSEGEEERFVKEVLMNFTDPGNTVLCILDNFDGNSLKVAELLFKNGFKEAYAIQGGLRGKDGWQEIQENLLPPSVHVYRRKKGKREEKLDSKSENVDGKSSNNAAASTGGILDGSKDSENGYLNPRETAAQANFAGKEPLSPYPNYRDLKPPSSPTPSKPK